MVAQAVHDHLKNSPAAQGEEHHEFHNRKTTAGLLSGGLGVAFLVFLGIGQLGGGTIDHFDGAALQLAGGTGAVIGGLSGGAQGLLQPFPRQAQAGLHVSRVALIDRALAVQPEEGLDLPHDLPAGGFGSEQLPDKALEGQAQGEDAVAAVGAVLRGGEQRGGQEVAQVFLELGQGGLTKRAGAAAQGGQPGAEFGEKRCFHSEYIYLPC